MSRWDAGWAGADSDVAAEMGQEVLVDGAPVEGVVTDREGGGGMVRGGLSEGRSATLHLSAEALVLVTVRDGARVKLADGTMFKVVGERGASGSGKAFILEGKWQ